MKNDNTALTTDELGFFYTSKECRQYWLGQAERGLRPLIIHYAIINGRVKRYDVWVSKIEKLGYFDWKDLTFIGRGELYRHTKVKLI